MAQDSNNSSPSTSIGTADLANASGQVEMLSAVRRALSTSSDAIVTAITAIATAVTQKLVGGVVGTTTNVLLKSKTVSSGSSAGSLQATGITVDSGNSISSPGTKLAITDAAVGNAGIELGSTASATTPYIDFHSSGNNTDYDARLIASGGSGSVGTGTLNFDCTTLTKSSVGIAIVTQSVCASFTFAFPENAGFYLIINIPFAWTITQTNVNCITGSATVQLDNSGSLINANSASGTTVNTVSQSSAVAIGGSVGIHFSSVSSDCTYLCLTIVGTRTLAS